MHSMYVLYVCHVTSRTSTYVCMYVRTVLYIYGNVCSSVCSDMCTCTVFLYVCHVTSLTRVHGRLAYKRITLITGLARLIRCVCCIRTYVHTNIHTYVCTVHTGTVYT